MFLFSLRVGGWGQSRLCLPGCFFVLHATLHPFRRKVAVERWSGVYLQFTRLAGLNVQEPKAKRRGLFLFRSCNALIKEEPGQSSVTT